VRFPPAILIVDEDADARTKVADLLSHAGYQITSVGSFREATKVLSTDPPDLLITELRLGAFNGLHLVLRSRTSHPGMAAIILTRFPDPILAAQAAQQGATYLVKPVDDAALLAIVSQKLERRQSPRKQVVGHVEVKIAATPARLVDLSYEGVQLELTGPEILSAFEMDLPAVGLRLPATVVWTRRPLALPGALRCGAAVAEVNVAATRAWREFVDSFPSSAGLQPP
jgi:DNA-binding response OmpR family regulator